LSRKPGSQFLVLGSQFILGNGFCGALRLLVNY
jgi:hypothetical protein